MERKPPTQEEIDAALQAAARLPKVSLADLPLDPDERIVIQFGNNFYMLFEALSLSEQQGGSDGLSLGSVTYLRNAEAQGAKWQLFLNRNRPLLDEMFAIFRGDWVVSSMVRRIHRDLCATADDRAIDDFERRIDADLGMDAIEIPFWQKLNLLLERAAKAMEEAGMDPRAIGR